MSQDSRPGAALRSCGVLLLGVCIGWLMSSWGRGGTPEAELEGVDPDRILAVVEGTVITVDDFEAEMARRGGPTNFASREGLRQLLNDMVLLEALAANARRSGLASLHDVRQETKHILAGRYREEHLAYRLQELSVTEQEIEDFYFDQRARYTIPAAARAALIYFAHPETASDQLKQEVVARAAAVRSEAMSLPAGADFGDLAARHSDDQASRYLGGDIGWLAEGGSDSRFDREIVEAIFALGEPGAMSELIETRKGVFVVRLVAERPAGLRPLEEVAGAVRHELLARKRRQMTDDFYAEAVDRVSVEVRQERLAAIEVPDASVAERARRPPPLPQS